MSNYGAVQLEEGASGAAPAAPRRKWRMVGAVAAVAAAALTMGLAADNASLRAQNAELAAQIAEPVGTGEAAASLDLNMALPSRHAVPLVTPRKTQDWRGTCWDFASMGALEQNYRMYGVKQGWLDADEYVSFSEQAYGVQVLHMCRGAPGSEQQNICRVPGDEIYTGKSTEGGEAPILYYFMNLLENAVLPEAVCPYTPFMGKTDRECAGREDALKHNPLRFTAMEFGTLYELDAIKRRLVSHSEAMTLSTGMAEIFHYYPCIGEFAAREECQVSSPRCHPCPENLRLTPCCLRATDAGVAPTTTQNYNMEGELIAHQDMVLEGGHAMLLVGFNDNYRTRDGDLGGLIVKNSWWDGTNPPDAPQKARGSHTMGYFMQEVSDWDERAVCPNSHSPYSWYTCGNDGSVKGVGVSGGQQDSQGSQEDEELPGLAECLSDETAMFAVANYQPLHLRCVDARFCDTDESVVYYATNMTNYGDRMMVFCAFEYPTADPSAARALCLPPMLAVQVAYVFEPVADELRENDPQYCGFYFIPYAVVQKYITAFKGFFVNWFSLQWSPESYLQNAPLFQHLDLDYSLIEQSTYKQPPLEFRGPFPRAQVVVPTSMDSP